MQDKEEKDNQDMELMLNDYLAHGNTLEDGSDNAYRYADRNRIHKEKQTIADGYQRRYKE